MKYTIGDQLRDEHGHTGTVVILWDDGDLCCREQDAAHADPKITGNVHNIGI